MNFPVLLAVALVPLVLGMIWYNPRVFGNAWMASAGIAMPDEKPGIGEMMKIFIPVYIFSFLFTFILQTMVIHQFGAYGMIGGNVDTALPSFKAFMDDYSAAFRTFKHGALHGTMGGLAFSLFMVGTTALFEKRGWMYILIHVGFFTICGAIMGSLLCGFI